MERISSREEGRVVDVEAVADGHDEDDDHIVLNVGDEAIIADAIAPLAAAVRGKAFSVEAGIGTAFEIFPNPCIDGSCYGWV